eukprot:COSAG05_NODE_3587_length_1973_cov_2.347385_1_plen_298_part_00
MHFSIGLASSSDREKLKTYFETRCAKEPGFTVVTNRRREEWCAFEKHAKLLGEDQSPNGRPVYVLELPGRDEAGSGLKKAVDSEARLANFKALLREMVEISRKGGRQPVFEPALTDNAKLEECQVELGRSKSWLTGHLEGPEECQGRSAHQMREQRQIVDYLEFLTWFDKRHDRHESMNGEKSTAQQPVEPPFLNSPTLFDHKAGLLDVAVELSGQSASPGRVQRLITQGLTAEQAEQLLEFALQKTLFDRLTSSEVGKGQDKGWCCCCSKRDRIGPEINHPLLLVSDFSEIESTLE